MRKRDLDPLLKLLGPAIGILIVLLSPSPAYSDGCFVMPPFVWDKQKDINEPNQKAILVYADGQEDLILQVKYGGPVEQFGWLIPVPGLPTVTKGSMECFYELSRYTQELWDVGTSDKAVVSAGAIHAEAPEPVKVIEIKTVGAYEVAVLSAHDSGSLEHWLSANGFSYPKTKEDVIAAYIRQQWYFVAAKIDLRKSGGFRMAPRLPGGEAIAKSRVSEKLASGELHPLQISFPTTNCVFPLKISSINGTPSEVQVYLLSREPLAEPALFEKSLPRIRRLTFERNQQQLAMRQRLLNEARQRAGAGDGTGTAPRVRDFMADRTMRMAIPYDELLDYAVVGAEVLPKCARQIARLSQGSWWLTKQTWTFRPEEMQDLVFEPAANVFASHLAGEDGYFAAQNLARLDSNAIPQVVMALQSTNAVARVRAASIAERFSDDRILNCLPALFKDPDPEVRMDAAVAARNNPSSKLAVPLLALLKDPDERVRREAVLALRRYYYGRPELDPLVQQLMQDDDLEVRACALELIYVSGSGVPVRRELVLPLLATPNIRGVTLALAWLERNGLACEDLAPSLRNPDAAARLAALSLLIRMNQFECVELVFPLLKDPDRRVRGRAAVVMQQWTDQQFNADETDRWDQWWATNKSGFLLTRYSDAVQRHPLNTGPYYHQRGCYYYDRHQFPDALKDFQKSAQMGSPVRDYSWFRTWLVQARLGQADAATRGLSDYLAYRKSAGPVDWRSKIGSFLAGKTSEAEFLAAAANADLKVDREQHCEAWFYAGTRRLIDGDKSTAEDYFRRSLATGITYFEEYHSAKAELKAMDAAAK